MKSNWLLMERSPEVFYYWKCIKGKIEEINHSFKE
jgi:hypothetical protein